jgi:GxxExxY protein
MAGAIRAPEISMDDAGVDGSNLLAEREDLDAVSEKVIGGAIEVHRTLGPGLLECIYRDCLVIELKARNLRVETERSVRLTYRGQPVATHLRVDLIVEKRVIVEVKAVEKIHPVHLAQVITYLKLTDCPVGLLLNFNATTLRAGLKRLVHPSVYVKKKEHPGLSENSS